MSTDSSMELLEERPFIKIWFDNENNWLYTEWTGDQVYDTVKEGGGLILKAISEKKVSKILNDNTLVTSSWSEASTEGGEVWFPTLVAAGIEYFAWVYSPFVFSRLSTDLSIAFARMSPVIKAFDKLEDAQEWLIKCQIKNQTDKKAEPTELGDSAVTEDIS